MRDKNNQPSRKTLMLFSSLNNEQDYLEALEELINWSPKVNVTSEEAWAYALGQRERILSELKFRLDVSCNNALVIFANLGLWNGRQNAIGYRQGTIWSAIEMCIKDSDGYSILLEKGNLKLDVVHHDGTNHFVIRELKNSDFRQAQDATYAGMSASGIAYHTRPIGGDVEKALGIERT